MVTIMQYIEIRTFIPQSRHHGIPKRNDSYIIANKMFRSLREISRTVNCVSWKQPISILDLVRRGILELLWFRNMVNTAEKETCFRRQQPMFCELWFSFFPERRKSIPWVIWNSWILREDENVLKDFSFQSSNKWMYLECISTSEFVI